MEALLEVLGTDGQVVGTGVASQSVEGEVVGSGRGAFHPKVALPSVSGTFDKWKVIYFLRGVQESDMQGEVSVPAGSEYGHVLIYTPHPGDKQEAHVLINRIDRDAENDPDADRDYLKLPASA